MGDGKIGKSDLKSDCFNVTTDLYFFIFAISDEPITKDFGLGLGKVRLLWLLLVDLSVGYDS